MPEWAMRALRFEGRYAAAPGIVYPWSNSLQVLRINAGTVAAKMVYLKSAWDRTLKHMVGEPMRVSMPRAVIGYSDEGPVSVVFSGPNPLPASFCFVNKTPESHNSNNWFSCHALIIHNYHEVA